jgi:hypothetical protein
MTKLDPLRDVTHKRIGKEIIGMTKKSGKHVIG